MAEGSQPSGEERGGCTPAAETLLAGGGRRGPSAPAAAPQNTSRKPWQSHQQEWRENVGLQPTVRAGEFGDR